MNAKRYPDPPWRTRGFAVLSTHLVPTRAVRVPEGLAPVTHAGLCTGILAYTEYESSSAMSHRELFWMPAQVRYRSDGRTYRGFFVAKMYVDDEAALAAGRELWALPKEMAQFERRGDRVEMRANDGTELSLSFRRLGPGWPMRSKFTTLQRAATVIRMRSHFRARAAPAWVRVCRLSSSEEGWGTFAQARPWSVPATVMSSLDGTLHVPERLSSWEAAEHTIHA